jgi:hypothetical protein
MTTILSKTARQSQSRLRVRRERVGAVRRGRDRVVFRWGTTSIGSRFIARHSVMCETPTCLIVRRLGTWLPSNSDGNLRPAAQFGDRDLPPSHGRQSLPATREFLPYENACAIMCISSMSANLLKNHAY